MNKEEKNFFEPEDEVKLPLWKRGYNYICAHKKEIGLIILGCVLGGTGVALKDKHDMNKTISGINESNKSNVELAHTIGYLEGALYVATGGEGKVETDEVETEE